MKKKLLLFTLPLLLLTSCENAKGVGGNQMLTGSMTYYYAYVKSQIAGEKYYHIKGWAEYGPEGGDLNKSYVGLELQLYTSGDVIYYYEQNLSYILMQQYHSEFGEAIE